jgi:hypothetical protein
MIGSWPIKVMLDVIFSRPDNLDRRADDCGNLHSLYNEIGLNTAAKSAARECHMDSDGIEWEPTDC